MAGFDDDLVIWTIYAHPADAPDNYVTRPWVVARGDTYPGQALLADTLAEARQNVPQGLFRMDRQPGDDATIVESWL